jgi:SprT protein
MMGAVMNRHLSVTDRCVEQIELAYKIAQDKLGLVSPFPTIRWDLRGLCAGRAYYRENLIRLNPVLLQDNVEQFIERTPMHEAAHLLAFRKHGGNIDPHGAEWRRVMWALGRPATRCHNYDVSTITGARPKSVVRDIPE